jgi:DNA-binding response OmpR family regulator
MKNLVTDEHKPNIMVVDDDRETSELIQIMLRERGYRVTLIKTGASAIAKLEEMVEQASPWRSFPIDLVLLDIMMPGVDGFKVCQVLKEHALLKYVPVIMVTALDAVADKVAAVQFGADDYITKPFLPEELDVAIGAKLQVRGREEALLRRNIELETINAVSAAAGSTLDARRVVEDAFAALMASTGLQGAIYVLDEAQGDLRRVAQQGVVRPESLPVDTGLHGRLFQLRNPILKANLEDDPELPADKCCAADVRSFAGVSLRVGERSLGILEVYHREPYGFDEDTLACFAEVGKRIGMALQNAQLFGRNQDLLLKSSSLGTNST